MSKLLALNHAARVLKIGTCSGHQVAILSRVAGRNATLRWLGEGAPG